MLGITIVLFILLIDNAVKKKITGRKLLVQAKSFSVVFGDLCHTW